LNNEDRQRGRRETAGPAGDSLLEIRDLTAGFHADEGSIRVLEDVGFSVAGGQATGLVGESGCGKSVSAMTVMRLLPSPPSFVEKGEVWFGGRNLLTLPEPEMRQVRGAEIGMIFQEPMTSLNPTFSIGWQLIEALMVHRDMTRDAAREVCVEMIERIGVGAARARMDQYPHELSGGLRQRIMIAMALVCGPKLLIADEPTTALDVTIQAQILTLLKDLQAELGMAVLMITHDLGVVAEFCADVYVMYAGRVIEYAAVGELFSRPRHPYTRGLLASRPRLAQKSEWLPTIPGMVPKPQDRNAGCYYVDRCERGTETCAQKLPPFAEVDPGHLAACWHPYR
jgi:oligopeptide/dipeptide ABC transporter ATP-binding protein